MRNLHEFANPLHHGPITCLCVDRKRVWLVVGTASGTLTLWDLRFGLLLRSWSVGTQRVHKIAVHPGRDKGRWVVVVTEDEGAVEETDPPSRRLGAQVAEVWDIDRGVKVEEFRVVSPGQPASGPSSTSASRRHSTQTESTGTTTMQDASPSAADAIEALLANADSSAPRPRSRLMLPTLTSDATITTPSIELRPSPRPGAKTFLVGVDYSSPTDARPTTSTIATATAGSNDRDGGTKRDGGYLITGGEDRKLRFWDLGRAGKSIVVSGLEMEEEAPTYRCVEASASDL